MKHKAFQAQAQELGPRSVRVICSTDGIDRAGEQIVQTGIDLSAFLSNPVVLWAHDPTQPIGRCSQIGLVNNELQATVEFAPPGVSPKADEICGMVKAGFVNTVSIGFDPLDTEPMDPKQPKGPERYKSIDLMELSFVSIPANKGALVVQRSIRTKAATSKWVACGADDLPIANDQDWDGRDAAKRILDDAGFDGDDPDHAKAMRGFLVYDSANPDLRGAYKLPFADIVSGKLMAVTDGIRAAASRISQTDIPDDVAKDAQAILDKYEAKIKDNEKAAKPQRGRLKQKGFGVMKVKSLNDICSLVYVLECLGWTQSRTRVETALEGDGSKMADTLAEIMQDLGTALIAMTAEEVGEAVAEAKGTLGQEDQMDETDDLPADEVTIIQTSKNPILRKFRAGYFRTKAVANRVKEGKKISAATADVLCDAVAMHKDAMKLHAKAIKAVESCMDDSDVTDTDSTGTDGDAGETSAEGKSAEWRKKRAAALRVK